MFTVLDDRMGRDPSGHTRREWLATPQRVARRESVNNTNKDSTCVNQ